MSRPAPADSPHVTRLSYQAAYSLLLGRELQLGENPMRCFCHDDEQRSCSVNTENGLWVCYATGNKGWLLQAVQTVRGCSVAEAKAQLLAWGIPVNGSRQPRGAGRLVRPAFPPTLVEGESQLGVYRASLAARPDLLSYLRDRRGLSDAMIARYELGLWERQDAFVFPYRNLEGELCNFKFHHSFREVDGPKSHGVSGHNSATIWPAQDLAAAGSVLLCEGEFDAMCASQYIPADWCAITSSLGAESWNPECSPLFAGKHVVVVYDCDRAGRDGAAKVAAELSGVAASVVVVDLGLGEKEDISDYFLQGGSWDGLEKLIAHARGTLEVPTADAVSGADVVPIQTAPRHWLADVLDDKGRPVPSIFGSKFVREWPLAMSGGWLYRYDWDRGVYVDDGEDWVARKIAALLGPLWKSRVHSELVHWLRIAASARQLWDPPPRHIINCENGLLNVRTRVLMDHSPDHLSPVQVPVTYDPQAGCSAITEFLHHALYEGDEQVFYEIAGWLLVPVVEFHRMVMLVGQGGTGKSTALKLLVAFIGERNRSTLPLHAITDDKFATADLLGKLINVCADIDSSDLRQTGVLKQITGGDAIRAQFKNKPAFSFTPYARMLFSANDPPATSDATQAFYRRFLIIPFTHHFASPDRNIDFKLQRASELSGLLNLALDGLDRLTEQGDFSTTVSIEKAKHLFRTETSTVAMFAEECLAHEYDGRVSRKDLFRYFRWWAKENNQGMRMTARAFNKQLVEAIPGLESVTINGYQHWKDYKYVGPVEFTKEEDVPF